MTIFERTGIEADLVTVWVGNNDLIGGVEPEAFADELTVLLDLVQDGLEAFVVIANLPKLNELPVFWEDPDDDVTPERIETFNQIIANEVADRGLALIDLFNEQVEADLVSDIDGLHPNNGGHERLAELFLTVFSDEL